MILTTEIQRKTETIIKKINSAKDILIISDRSMVDEDCIYSGLALRWLCQYLGKEVDNVIFAKKNDTFAKKKDVELVKSVFVDEVDFNKYDLIFLVDSPKWSRILTDKADEILMLHSKEKFVLFDHHLPEDIDVDLGDQSINYSCSSAGLLIYETLFKTLKITPDLTCAEYIYRTVISDTLCLKVNSNADTFTFCAEFQRLGVDHQRLVEEFFTISKDAIDFFAYCLSRTEYVPEISSTVLFQDEEFEDYCNQVFGDTWREVEMLSFYKENFMRRIEGFDHGLIFWAPYDRTKTKVSWRSKENSNFNLAEYLNSLGFVLGGHKNAGGGRTDMSMEEIKRILID